MQSQLRTGTILWTHRLSPSIALVQSLLPLSCAILILRKKRVSARFVSIDSLVYTCFFFFHKCFPLVGITTKFNKDMYAKMRLKKDESLSNLGKRTVRITGKGPSATPSALVAPTVTGTKVTRTGSPATYVEEIPTPTSKRSRLEGKGKEKADSRASSIWDDAELVVERAHGVVTAEDLKVFSSVSKF